MKPRAAIDHPHIGRGGSEAHLIWLIEALKADFDITVITTGGWNLAELNSMYGTSVESGEVGLRLAPFPGLLAGFDAAALRGSCYQRFCRSVAGEFDLRISAYNCTDWGLQAIRWIADFVWDERLSRRAKLAKRPLTYRRTPLRWLYLAAARRIARPAAA